MEKLIITVATTGAHTTKEQSPYVCLHPIEIAEEVYACWQAGASMAHIHVRDEDGNRTLSIEKYIDTINEIRKRCDIIINLTTTGRPIDSEEERMLPVELLPELVSFDAGSINFGAGVFINSPPFLESLARKTKEYNVKPEIEIFDAGMVDNAVRLAKNGLIDTPLHFQFVLGVTGGMSGDAKNLVFLKEAIPKDATWSALGVGKYSKSVMCMTIAMGGHVRVGMEDNIYIRKGVLAKSNVEFIKEIVQIAEINEREIASVEEARRILGIQRKEIPKRFLTK